MALNQTTNKISPRREVGGCPFVGTGIEAKPDMDDKNLEELAR